MPFMSHVLVGLTKDGIAKWFQTQPSCGTV
jgi:hypothetical protein